MQGKIGHIPKTYLMSLCFLVKRGKVVTNGSPSGNDWINFVQDMKGYFPGSACDILYLRRSGDIRKQTRCKSVQKGQTNISGTMKRNIILITFLLLSGAFILDASGQNLVIVNRDGVETMKPLDGIRKCTFSGNYLVLNFPDGKTESYSLPLIRKILFSASTTATRQLPEANKTDDVTVFPNPMGNRISYRNVPEGSVLKLLRIDGMVVISTVSPGREGFLMTERLSQGLYILKINNQAFKLIKQ
jgi:hypothetical protein